MEGNMLRIIFLIVAFQLSTLSHTLASDLHDHSSHNHNNGHTHLDVDGSQSEVDPDKYKNFISGLSNEHVAIIDVKGMVCDFCARGIEKTFYEDKEVKKVNVDLGAGKVFVAYSKAKEIDVNEIKNIFLINGQTATKVIINKL